jgi:RHS repeat-associated protein
VTHVTPAAGAYALETLEVIGEGFGTSAGTSSVTINGTTASATPVSDTHLQVAVPTGATSGDLVVTRSGVASTGYAVTILDGPVITSMTPTWGPEGTTVSITGTNFGSSLGAIRTHAGEPALHVEVTDWTPTHITATVPAGVTSGLLTVTDAGGHASRGRPFTVDTEEVVYYHSDAIGSVRMVTGVEGAVIERHDFQPFGEEVGGAVPMQVGFAGAEADHETASTGSLAFNYLGARQLHGASARFLGVDPGHVGGSLSDPQSWNGYAYAVNNPLRFVDPNGRQGIPICTNLEDCPPVGPDYAAEQNAATNDLIAGRLRYDAGLFQVPPQTGPCEQYGDCGTAFQWPSTNDLVFEAATWLAGEKIASLAIVGLVRGVELVRGARAARGTIDLARAARAAKGTTVLGKFPDYVKLADSMAAKRFNIPTSVWNRMTSAEQWAANQKFLDRAIARGDDILLSNPVKNINSVTGAFRQELDYLAGKGFRLSPDGTRLIR